MTDWSRGGRLRCVFETTPGTKCGAPADAGFGFCTPHFHENDKRVKRGLVELRNIEVLQDAWRREHAKGSE